METKTIVKHGRYSCAWIDAAELVVLDVSHTFLSRCENCCYSSGSRFQRVVRADTYS